MRSEDWRIVRALLFGLSVACLSSIPYWFDDMSVQRFQHFDLIMLPLAIPFLPGLFFSMIFSGNVHNGNLWNAAVMNLAGYAGLYWLVARVWLRNRKQGGGTA
jgi:hypothetical protein